MRRSKIPVKTIPAPVQWILTNATLAQLDFLDKMGKAEDFKQFINLVDNFKHYNVYKLYNAPFQTPEELVAMRAAVVGEVSGLDTLIMACQWAKEEKERRKNAKS